MSPHLARLRRVLPLQSRRMACKIHLQKEKCVSLHKFLLRLVLRSINEPGWYHEVSCSRPQDICPGGESFFIEITMCLGLMRQTLLMQCSYQGKGLLFFKQSFCNTECIFLDNSPVLLIFLLISFISVVFMKFNNIQYCCK